MTSQGSRRDFVYIAKLAAKAKRYDEMVSTMKKVAMMEGDLTIEERNLLSVGYNNVIGARRASWRILSYIEQEEEAKGNKQHVKIIREYKHLVESEITDTCNDIMAVINEHLIPSASPGEPSVFYIQMKGDYYRYLAEFKSSNDKKEAAEQSLEAYQAASNIAYEYLTPLHPIRLGLALNFSIFCYEIMNSPERACYIAKHAFYGALSELDDPNDEKFKDSTTIMQLLSDNLIIWTTGLLDEDDNAKKNASKPGDGQEKGKGIQH